MSPFPILSSSEMRWLNANGNPARLGSYFTYIVVALHSSWKEEFSSVTQSCPTLCDPIDCSTPGFLVHHHLPEFPQVNVPCISDAIQASHPLSPSSPSAFYLSQHQCFPVSQLFITSGQSVGTSASVQ